MRAVYPCLYGHTPGFLPPAIFGQLSTLTWRRNNVVSNSPPGRLGGADNRSIYWKQRWNNSLYSSALLCFSLRWNIFLQHVSKWFLMDKGFVFWTSAIWWWITLTWLLIQSINATRDVIPGTSYVFVTVIWSSYERISRKSRPCIVMSELQQAGTAAWNIHWCYNIKRTAI